MNFGCIGEHLKHSFSKEIHALLGKYDYSIKEISKEDIGSFLLSRDFLGINVTIPYKETVIPYLYYIDEAAEKIGAVNTVVNKGGKLYGYNTDFYGMNALISHAGISVKDKKSVILGTGGTSKTAEALLLSLGAREVIKVGRTKRDGNIDYEELYSRHADAEIIVNTTPVGMYPSIHESPVDISRFHSLSGVIDAVYNPLRTCLVLDAKERGIPAEGGLYMLVAQAFRASEIFTGVEYPEELLSDVYEKILASKENIVLTGMPASGKSTVGEIIKERTSRNLIDTDLLCEQKDGRRISEIFESSGESSFRDLESRVIKEISNISSSIIATGGGAVLRKENLYNLRHNGRIFLIDRPLDSLIPTSDRPLANSKEAIIRRYNERIEIYRSSADVIIDAKGDIKETVDKISGVLNL